MSRLRLRVSHQDKTLVVAQGATKRSYKPFAIAFGKRSGATNADSIVTAVNCHNHLIKAMQAIHRTARRPANGNARLRLSLIARYASAALSKVSK